MDFLLPQHYQAYIPAAAVGLLVFCCFFLLVVPFLLRYRDIRREFERKTELLEEYRRQNSTLKDELNQEQIRAAKLLTLLKTERRGTHEKLVILEDARENLLLQFQSLAQRIFEEKSEKFGHENKERVSALLQPLQEQLRVFQKRIDDIQVNDVRERSSLKEEILHLRDLNQQINKEAANLTRALRGDKKMQGNWGELVLERVLEKSGLRKGEEYTVQTGYRNGDNQLLKPDVVIHLPDHKDIIIDSKVSLTAWEKYINCDDDKEKSHFLKEHIQNIRNHIKGLNHKNYSDLNSLHSLDFVLLFIPIDSSFIAAYENDENLFGDAYEQRIIIVTPTTLLATLKTVENLWRYEHRNRNSREIADRAGAIYDKLCGFLEEMEKVGKQLSTCTATYDAAMNKLTRGRGNVISQAGKLTELGISVKKKIPQSITALSDTDLVN
ncbi:DNA recombination protein RmuC [Desulfopila inferna]|uniref:DNA recombination protein RmuC n=1 Tax=Desulfopila inferna TaxID=468528 RepID=UPI001964EB54|nr:DNA recombination protein RmuC [Desulfopila inferna]MBM9606310.1 DNA recombination protein RmuC [Desulfopila inferna]